MTTNLPNHLDAWIDFPDTPAGHVSVGQGYDVAELTTGQAREFARKLLRLADEREGHCAPDGAERNDALPVRVPGATLPVEIGEPIESAFVALDGAFDGLAGVRQSLVALRGESA